MSAEVFRARLSTEQGARTLAKTSSSMRLLHDLHCGALAVAPSCGGRCGATTHLEAFGMKRLVPSDDGLVGNDLVAEGAYVAAGAAHGRAIAEQEKVLGLFDGL